MKMSEGGAMLWGGLGGACVHPGSPEAQSPFPHATLGGLDGAGFPHHMAFVGAPGVHDAGQPILQVPQWIMQHFVLVFQKIVVLLQQCCFALCELLSHLGEQFATVAALLGRDGGVVDVVPVVPHLPHHQPKLVDELGAPVGARASAGVMVV